MQARKVRRWPRKAPPRSPDSRVARVYLLRHADHDLVGRALAGRLPGVALNARGVEQAAELPGRFAGLKLDAIYCTPQPRTRQTAAPLAQAQGLELRVSEAFDEVDFGAWTGLSFAEVQARDPEGWQTWNTCRGRARPAEGEAFVDVASRVELGFRDLARLHGDGAHVAVVSHADVLRALVARLLGMSLDHLERLEIAPASVTVVDAGEDWLKLRLLNGQGKVPELG